MRKDKVPLKATEPRVDSRGRDCEDKKKKPTCEEGVKLHLGFFVSDAAFLSFSAPHSSRYYDGQRRFTLSI